MPSRTPDADQPPTPERLAHVRAVLSAETPLPMPADRAAWDALPIEDRRALRAARPDFRRDDLPAGVTEAERSLAAMINRAEIAGLPTTREQWEGLTREQRAELLAGTDAPEGARVVRPVSSWYTPRHLPRTTPPDVSAGYRASMQKVEDAERRYAEAKAAADHRGFRPESHDERKAREARAVDRSVTTYPATFRDYESLSIEAKRGLRERFPSRNPRALPGGPHGGVRR